MAQESEERFQRAAARQASAPDFYPPTCVLPAVAVQLHPPGCLLVHEQLHVLVGDELQHRRRARHTGAGRQQVCSLHHQGTKRAQGWLKLQQTGRWPVVAAKRAGASKQQPPGRQAGRQAGRAHRIPAGVEVELGAQGGSILPGVPHLHSSRQGAQ